MRTKVGNIYKHLVWHMNTRKLLINGMYYSHLLRLLMNIFSTLKHFASLVEITTELQQLKSYMFQKYLVILIIRHQEGSFLNQNEFVNLNNIARNVIRCH